MTVMPQRNEVVTERAGGDVIAFHPRTHVAHALSADVARVWDLCDGRTAVDAVATSLNLTVSVVEQALAVLAEAELVTSSDLTRRVLLQRASLVAGGAVAMASIPQLLSPTLAAAASGANGPQIGGSSTGSLGSEDIQDIIQGQYVQLPAGTIITGFTIAAANSVPNGDVYYEIRDAKFLTDAPGDLRVQAPGTTTPGGGYSITGLHYVVPSSGQVLFDVYPTYAGQHVYDDYGYGDGGFAYKFLGSSGYTYEPGEYNKIYTLFGFPPGSGLRRAGSTATPHVLSSADRGDISGRPLPSSR